MKLFKQLALGALGLVLSVSPSLARVEEGTYSLLETLEHNGVSVVYNTGSCDGTVYGLYMWSGFRREMVLCPGDTVTAIDHKTVRHEVSHSIQHCVNAARNTSVNSPIMSIDELVDAVNTVLSQERVSEIKSLYSEDEWAVEFEANVMAEIFTATELKDMFLRACVAE
jgi:hypothetical protein